MLISSDVTCKEVIRETALVWVRSVVPNPGIVMPTIPFRGSPSLSKVFTQTNNARVESNPPEMPSTTVWHPVCTRRLAKPATWIEKISSQRSPNNLSPEGTKG